MSSEAYDAAVFELLDQTKGLLLRCYQDVLSDHLPVSARVSFDFVVGGEGYASPPSFAASEFRQPHSEYCATEVLQQTRFPPPATAGLEVASYTYALSVIAGSSAVPTDTSTTTQSALLKTLLATQKYFDECYGLALAHERVQPPPAALKLFVSTDGLATATEFVGFQGDSKVQNCVAVAVASPNYGLRRRPAAVEVSFPFPKTSITQNVGDTAPHSHHTATSTSVDSSLSKAEIAQTIYAQISDVRRCYEDRLRRRHTLWGRIVIELVIQRPGHVSSSAVHFTSVLDAKLEACLQRVLGSCKFRPRPAGGDIRVYYPLVFGAAR